MIRVVFAERPTHALPVLYDSGRQELTISAPWWRSASLWERYRRLARFEAVRAQGLLWWRQVRHLAPPTLAEEV